MKMDMLAIFMLFGLANGGMQERFSRELIDFPTIYVDPSNLRSFRTIQSAINSVPSKNNRWICISIKAGTYKYVFHGYINTSMHITYRLP